MADPEKWLVASVDNSRTEPKGLVPGIWHLPHFSSPALLEA